MTQHIIPLDRSLEQLNALTDKVRMRIRRYTILTVLTIYNE